MNFMDAVESIVDFILYSRSYRSHIFTRKCYVNRHITSTYVGVDLQRYALAYNGFCPVTVCAMLCFMNIISNGGFTIQRRDSMVISVIISNELILVWYWCVTYQF